MFYFLISPLTAIKVCLLSMGKDGTIYFLVNNVSTFRLPQEPTHSRWDRRQGLVGNGSSFQPTWLALGCVLDDTEVWKITLRMPQYYGMES